MGLSPVNKDHNVLGDLKAGEYKSNGGAAQVTDVYNFVNISQDDAQSLMGLFGDFSQNYVTLKLANG
jgi:hypothetical protein